MRYIKYILTLIAFFVSVNIQAQTITGGSGNCTVDADPNTISDLNTQDTRIECLRLYNTADSSFYYYVVANNIGSRWIKEEFLTQVQIQNIVSDTADVLRTYADQSEQDAKDYADANDDSGTDDQTLSFSNPNLSIENGNSLDLSSVLPFFRSGSVVLPNFTSTNMELRLNGTETNGGNFIRSRIGAGGDFLWAIGDDGALFGQGRNGLNAYVYGNYPFTVATNAVRRLIVTGAGNVGINTLTPSFKLDINGTVGMSSLSDGSAHTELVTRNNTTGELGYNLISNIQNWTINETNIYSDLSNSLDSALYSFAAGTDAGTNRDVNYQIAIGRSAGQNNTGNQQNAFGRDAGQNNTGDNQNAFGYGAGNYNTGAYQNAFGGSSGADNTGSYQNAFGFNAGRSNTSYAQNAFGFQAGQNNTGIFQNAFGFNAGRNNTGDYQIAFGREAGQNNTADDQNAFGRNAGLDNTGIYQNAFGRDAGRNNTGVEQNAFGFQAGRLNTGNQQNAFGRDAGENNTGDFQNAFGYVAGENNTGIHQNAFGYGAGSYNKGGEQQAFGFLAGFYNQGYSNISIGNNAGRSVQRTLSNPGDYNTWLNYQAGFAITEGNYNIGIGREAGDIITDGDNNIYIGGFASASDSSATNEIAIGYNVTGAGNNTVTIGNSSITDNYFTGDMNISGGATVENLINGSSHTQLVTRNGATGELGYATNNISNWDTAFGWGDHSTQNYVDDDNITNPYGGTNTVQAGLDSTKSYTDQAEQDAKDYADANDDTGTDSQTLSFTNPNLSISGGNSVDISGVNYWTKESATELSFDGRIRINDGSSNIVIQNAATSGGVYGTGSLVIGTNGLDTVGIHSYNQGAFAAYQGNIGIYSYNQGNSAARDGSIGNYSYNQGAFAAYQGNIGIYSYNQGKEAVRLGTVGNYSYNQGNFAAYQGSVGDHSYNHGNFAAREGSIGDNVFSYGRNNFYQDTIGNQITAIGSFISSDANTITNSYAFGHNIAINQSNQVIFDNQVTRFDIGNSRFDVGTTPTSGDIWQHDGTEFTPTLKSSIPLSDFDDTGYWQSTDFSSSDIANWNTAYGWGDHSTAGYLTSEVDGSTTNELQTIDEVLTQGNSLVANRSINVNGNQMQIGGAYASMLARTFDVTLSSFDLSLNTADIITDTGEILLRHRLSGDVGADQDYITLDATNLTLEHRNGTVIKGDVSMPDLATSTTELDIATINSTGDIETRNAVDFINQVSTSNAGANFSAGLGNYTELHVAVHSSSATLAITLPSANASNAGKTIKIFNFFSGSGAALYQLSAGNFWGSGVVSASYSANTDGRIDELTCIPDPQNGGYVWAVGRE